MTATALNVIQAFEGLNEVEKKDVAAVIIRRTLDYDLPPMTDEEFVLHAEGLFLQLDQREAENGETNTRKRGSLVG